MKVNNNRVIKGSEQIKYSAHDSAKHKVNQVGIKGENVEINANNVYIINNNYNEPVYNNFNNKFYNTYSIPYYNNYYNFYPSFFVTPFFWCYTFPFVPWFPIVLPFMWRW